MDTRTTLPGKSFAGITVALLLALSGCGGGGGESASVVTPPPPVPVPVVATLSVLAGGTESGNVDGTGSAARFSNPGALGIDAAGNLYVADQKNNAIRRVTPSGVVSTFASNVGTKEVLTNTGSFQADEFRFELTVDKLGNVVITDENAHLASLILPDGAKSVIAGRQWPNGSLTGLGAFVGHSSPKSVTSDSSGNFYAVDRQQIRKFALAGVDSVVTCSSGNLCLVAGGGGIAVDPLGNIFVVSGYGHAVTKITLNGVATILAGSDSLGFTDGTGTAARLNYPAALGIDPVGNLLVADTYNNAVRKITPAGVVTTIAGKPGANGIQPGPLPASLTLPRGIAVHTDGTIYVTSENAILKIQP